MHVAFYALMILMPLAGWLMLSAQGKPIPFFGLQLPALISESKELAKLIKEIHSTAGTVGYFLIGLHALAALFHHFVLRDNTLRRMLPIRPGSKPVPAASQPVAAQIKPVADASASEIGSTEQPATEHEANPGLSSAMAAERLKSDGYNELPRPDQRGFMRILFEVLRQPMFALLIGGGIVYLLMGDRIEALLLLMFAGLSVTITIVQETRSEKVLEALRT